MYSVLIYISFHCHILTCIPSSSLYYFLRIISILYLLLLSLKIISLGMYSLLLIYFMLFIMFNQTRWLFIIFISMTSLLFILLQLIMHWMWPSFWLKREPVWMHLIVYVLCTQFLFICLSTWLASSYMTFFILYVQYIWMNTVLILYMNQ